MPRLSAPAAVTPKGRPQSTLWRHRDFANLWAGQTVSAFGSQVTNLALPLTAVLVLGASPFQMGLLQAVETIPFFFFSLLAGVWLDHMRRRPVLIAADLGRALLIGSVPIVALAHHLSMPYLYAVGLFGGTLGVFFDVAYQSYLPGIIERVHLVDGNSKLQLSSAVSGLAGPGLATILISLLGAPTALAADALSFLASVTGLARIKTAEPLPTRTTEHRNLQSDIRVGVQLVFGNAVLRGLVGAAGTLNLAGDAMFALLVLYLTRIVGFSVAQLGFVYSSGGIGALIGALVTRRVAARFGLGPTLISAVTLVAAGVWLVPLGGEAADIALSAEVAAAFLAILGLTASNIVAVSLRQSITPDRLLGRMTATFRFVTWGVRPVSALAAGALGSGIGLRPTLFLAALASLAALPWLYFSPIRNIRERPRAAPDRSDQVGPNT